MPILFTKQVNLLTQVSNYKIEHPPKFCFAKFWRGQSPLPLPLLMFGIFTTNNKNPAAAPDGSTIFTNFFY